MRINYTKKNNDNIDTCIESKINSKVVSNEETESVGKQIHMRNLQRRNQQTFTKFSEILTMVKIMIIKKIN